ncbi:UDP-GlcNAc:betaGal beta-1,3-N-acetylglucosaminyltransferase-like protein 1 [Chionoecetes opilio]|uniref:UDP-GlcNAc:betaGal beta-1,3-N-acetylglucosaminyltransferase-like protein 1 n=1 Tax=Chionoecetes opilio TaxID=41210 RepID=A0A8J5CSJ0_CHIOP|nr:UDP-GlcNAc:betaGal beta-1,3-N-acetylglucosaminyltransferase-like protein 1 [Chionoecetes opilio]
MKLWRRDGSWSWCDVCKASVPSTEAQNKVVAFCDVDAKKVNTFYTYEASPDRVKPRVPILHFTKARPPLVICMKLELTGGKFEENLASLKLQEGKDYHLFN